MHKEMNLMLHQECRGSLRDFSKALQLDPAKQALRKSEMHKSFCMRRAQSVHVPEGGGMGLASLFQKPKPKPPPRRLGGSRPPLMPPARSCPSGSSDNLDNVLAA